MSDEKPEIQLFIKSSTIDREQKGSCPLCQQWFMAACILTEQDILSFHVTIVDAESPPKEFKDLSQSKIFPVVKGIRGLNKRGQDIGDKLADDHEGLEAFFESFGCPDLKRDGAVQKHFDDLYKHFNAFLHLGNDQGRHRLVVHLEKLNRFLEGEDQIYVINNVITYGDCYLMPRIHHIKVAGREFADFEIPEDLFYVWRYLYETYKTDAFQKTCPTDQDIIKHYEKKAKTFKPKKGVPSLQKATYSFDIPESILNSLENEFKRQDAYNDNSQLYENADNHGSGNQAEETETNTAPDNDFEQEFLSGYPHDDPGAKPETMDEDCFGPEQDSFDAEPASYAARNGAEPAQFIAEDQPEPTTYEAPFMTYESPIEQDFNTYETTQSEGNTYDDAENNLSNSTPPLSANPELDHSASPTPSKSLVPDGGANIDNLDQTYDDLIGHGVSELPLNSTSEKTAFFSDQRQYYDDTQDDPEELPYENVETQGVFDSSSKSVDFSIPNENQGKGVEASGTNADD